MRKLLAVALLILFSAPGFATWPQGIDFRSSLLYVTDPANYASDTATLGLLYPWTTAQGNNVGFEATGGQIDYRDRNSALDARLAGIARSDSLSTVAFRIDITAGSWQVGGGFGDATNAVTVGWDLYDTASNLVTLASGAVASGSFKDATNTTFTAANWPASNTLITRTFSTTILRIKSTAISVPIANVYVNPASATTCRGGIALMGAGGC